MRKRLYLTAILALIAAFSHAATVNTFLHLEMDGSVDGSNNYINDSGGATGNALWVRPGSNNPVPSFADGVMYNKANGNTNQDQDPVLIADVGSGFSPQDNYIIEMWVKPDYANFPAGSSDNQWSGVRLISWWEIYDWCTSPVTGTYMAGLYMSASNQYLSATEFAGAKAVFNETGEPNDILSPTEFSHVAAVVNYDSDSSLAIVDLYINGEIKESASALVDIGALDFPTKVGIANIGYTRVYDEEGNYDSEQAGCGADMNYNQGFSGWIDSVAMSTFTGEFDITDFVLPDPQQCGDVGTVYNDTDLNNDCIVDLADFNVLAGEWLADLTG
jgi:hypothetical protein